MNLPEWHEITRIDINYMNWHEWHKLEKQELHEIVIRATKMCHDYFHSPDLAKKVEGTVEAPTCFFAITFDRPKISTMRVKIDIPSKREHR
jgi:hypothetical protein